MNRPHPDDDTFRIWNPAFEARVHARRRISARKVVPADDQTMERETRIRRALLRGLFSNSSVKQIIAYVAAKHGFTYEDVLSPLRSREVVACRVEAVQEVKRRKPDMSNSAIGREFKRDHSTIHWALKKCSCAQRAEAV